MKLQNRYCTKNELRNSSVYETKSTVPWLKLLQLTSSLSPHKNWSLKIIYPLRIFSINFTKSHDTESESNESDEPSFMNIVSNSDLENFAIIFKRYSYFFNKICPQSSSLLGVKNN